MPIRRVPRLFQKALAGWWNDNVPRLGASLSFYTIFALAPVLLVAIAVAGAVYGEDAVRGRVVAELADLVGSQSAQVIQTLLARTADRPGGTLATVLGGVTFVFASTGAFLELQAALNQIWDVKAVPSASILSFLRQRLISFGLVVAIGFLLMVTLVVSAGLAAAGEWAAARVPATVVFWNTTNTLLAFAVTTVLFALLYKVLPDVRLEWRDVWVGAAATALLFTLGKYLIGLYLGRSATSSSYGAAGAFAVLLLWVYYSSQIVLIGAEFTRAYAEARAGRPEPQPHAMDEETGRMGPTEEETG